MAKLAIRVELHTLLSLETMHLTLLQLIFVMDKTNKAKETRWQVS
jgi:hypothetical protein